MEMWTEIRRRVLGGEISRRQACREYNLHWDTIQKVLAHAEPPGYRKKQTRGRQSFEAVIRARFRHVVAEEFGAWKRFVQVSSFVVSSSFVAVDHMGW